MYSQYRFNHIHIITQPLDRRQVKLDFLYSTGGSWFEPPQHRGRKHLLEHCIASRTADKNFEELKQYSFRENLNLNAYTSDVVMGLNASGHSSDFAKMFEILLEMFVAPTFDQSILQREKEVVLREISERSGDPQYRLYFDTVRAMYTPDSLEPHEVLGSSKAVAATTLDDFYDLHHQNLTNSHLFIMCSGGGIESHDWIHQQLDAFFESHPQAARLVSDTTDLMPLHFHPGNQLQSFDYKPIVHPLAHQHAEVSIFVPVDVTFDTAPEMVFFDNLFIKHGGTLHDVLRDKKQLLYGIYGVFRRSLNMLELQFSCEIDKVEEIVDAITTTLTDAPTFLPQDKFDIFTNLLHKRIEMSADSLGSETKFISERLLSYGVAEDYAEYIQRLQAVSYKDVQAVYQQMADNWSGKQIAVVSASEKIEGLFATV